MSRLAYYRISSTQGQSIEAQRQALGGGFDKEFTDEGVSGATRAADRPGFAALLNYVREGDVIHVYALDRLGRDALDVQSVLRGLMDKSVTVDVLGIGPIGRGVGELVAAVVAHIADMERQRIRDRCDSGRAAARTALAATGRTHKGKESLGRPTAADRRTVVAWRKANQASLRETAAHFDISKATVARYWATEPPENAATAAAK